jgi:hypothetical protein
MLNNIYYLFPGIQNVTIINFHPKKDTFMDELRVFNANKKFK